MDLDRLGRAVDAVINNPPVALDQYQRTALARVRGHLNEMAEECRSDRLRPKKLRHGYVARLVAEMDPSVLHPALGGQLIDAENEYRAL